MEAERFLNSSSANPKDGRQQLTTMPYDISEAILKFAVADAKEWNTINQVSRTWFHLAKDSHCLEETRINVDSTFQRWGSWRTCETTKRIKNIMCGPVINR